WDELRELSPLQIGALLVFIAVRQFLNAFPVALFLPELGVRRAVAGDLSASLVAFVAPSPTDAVLRATMLNSWGIRASDALSAITLNSMTYYVARFTAPVLGLIVAVIAGIATSGYAYTALSSGVVSVFLIALLVLAARGENPAGAAAFALATYVSRFFSSIKPSRWRDWTTKFVKTVGATTRTKGIPAVVTSLGLVLAEATLLMLSMRFAGVPSSAASAVAIYVALLISYPLTALPFAAIGVLDAALISLLALNGGPYEAQAVAGMIICRVCWQLVPLMLGVVTLSVWRLEQAKKSAAPQA
ncbi:MAG: hypothetical protein JWP10_830, partial [Nocardioidaceae bacterium]|nr:hypothetical protein [Nocardioidaceae bacterium]